MINRFQGKVFEVKDNTLYIDGLKIEGFKALHVRPSMYDEQQPYIAGYIKEADAHWGHWIKNAQYPIEEWVYDPRAGCGRGNKKPLWLAGVSRRKVLTINGTEMPLQPSEAEAVKVRRKKGAKKLDH